MRRLEYLRWMTARGWRLWAVAYLWLSSAGSPFAAEEYSARTWTTDHGLPQNTVQAILQTRDGYLWVGTRFGLARFDGQEFRSFNAGNVPELAEASVSAIAEDAQGVLWVGTLGGLVRMERGRFSRLAALEGRRVWAVWPGTDGTIWLGLNEGLATLREERLELLPLPTAAGGRVRSLTPLDDGSLLVPTLTGWVRFVPDTRQFTPWLPDLKPTPDAARSPPVDAGHWRREGMPVSSAATFAHDFFYQRARGVTGNTWGPRLAPDGAGGWWAVNARRQLVQFGYGDARRLIPPREDVLHEVLCAAVDREGGLWLGSSVAGLTRLSPRRFEHFRLGEGEEAACFTVAATADGSVWAAAKTRLLRWRSGHAEVFPLSVPDPYNQIFALLPDELGGVWLARDRGGLLRWQPEEWTDFSPTLGVTNARVRSLARTRDGVLWLGRRTGLTCWDGRETRHYGTNDGLPHLDVRAIHEDRAGRLWVATFGGGVARRIDGSFQSVPLGPGSGGGIWWGFHEDRSGALWIYGQRGLVRVRGDSIATVRQAQGLFDDLNNQLLEDDAGDFWLGCNRGLYRVRGEELHAVAEGRQATVDCTVFGVADGLPVAETNGESQPAGARAADGTLWFPTPVGVVRVNPARVPRHEIPPPLQLESVVTETLTLVEAGRGNPDLRRTAAGVPRLPPGSARILSLRYTAPSFAAPERVRFRHRLLGYETNWVEAGGRRETHYTNLRPGRYRFEFTACNDHGVWNPEPAAFAFELAPHFWETRFFPAFVVGAMLFGGWGLHRIRLRLVRRRLVLENELGLARERERIARDMHDDVGAGLTQIGFLTDRASRADGAQLGPLLGRIADASRDTAQAMDEIVWAVNPRNDRLEHLANYVCQFAREFLEPTGIRCRFDVPTLLPDSPVPSDVRHHLLMVLKESLSNAVRHSGATEVTLELRIEGVSLRLAVVDNGRGFDPDGPGRSRSGRGNGLANLQRRAETIGGWCVVESGPGAGTRIEVAVSLVGKRMANNE